MIRERSDHRSFHGRSLGKGKGMDIKIALSLIVQHFMSQDPEKRGGATGGCAAGQTFDRKQ